MPTNQQPITVEKKPKSLSETDEGRQRLMINNFDRCLHTAWNFNPVSLLLAFLFSASISDLFSPQNFSISFSAGWDITFFTEKIEAFNLDQPQLPTKIHLHLHFVHLLPSRSTWGHTLPLPTAQEPHVTWVSSLIYSTSPSLNFKNQLYWGVMYI